MLGPQLPSVGGIATVIENLRDSVLSQRCRLKLLNTGKSTPANRSLLVGMVAQIRLFEKLSRAILSHKTQIVHIHTCSGFIFWRDCVHMLLARLLRCQVVWHIHGGCFREFVSDFGPLRKFLLKHLFQLAYCVIVLSPYWKRKLEPFAPTARWCIVPNGVSTFKTFNKSGGGKAKFLFLGNMEKRKGGLDLVFATAIALGRGFNGIVSLAGAETAIGQREEIERRIRESNCGSNFRLLDSISGQRKNRELVAADCLVLPSYVEGLPMAILEGMAYGLPIISTNVGAIPEVISDGVEGFLIEPGDVEALADRMVLLGSDVNLRQQMGRAARRRVQEHYSLEAMVERLMNIYREAMGQG